MRNNRCLLEINPVKPLQMCSAWNYADVRNWRGNGDGSAFSEIDCCPLAQLNESLHLYDKQLHLIQPLVFCCPSIRLSFGDVVALSVICILRFSFPSCRCHIFFLSGGQIERKKKKNICKTCHLIGILSRQHTSSTCFFKCFTHLTGGLRGQQRLGVHTVT